LLRDLRSLLGRSVERIPEFALLRPFGQALRERPVNLVLYKKATTRGAALATVEIDGVESAGDGLVKVTVGEDHVRALAAQLERDALERVGSAFLDDLGRLVVASESDLVNVGMRDNGRARRLAVAVEDIDNPVREARFERQLGHAHAGQRR